MDTIIRPVCDFFLPIPNKFQFHCRMSGRKYKKSDGKGSEYAYQSQSTQKKNRAARNKVRRAALRAGRVKKGDGKDIHHKDGNPRNSSAKNLAVVSKKYNRSRNS